MRVVRAGPTSLEFCGGTHVDSLGQIGPITLLSEGSIGSNTRRIFAADRPRRPWSGRSSASSWCNRAAELLRTEPDELLAAIGRLMERQREAEKELARLRQQSSEAEAKTLADAAAADGGVVVARRDKVEPDALRTLAQAVLRHDGVRAVVLGGSPDGTKAAIVAATGGTPDATQLVRTLGPMVGGGRRRVGRAGAWRAARTRRGSRRRWPRRSGFCPRERRRGRARARAGWPRSISGRARIGVAYSDSGRSLASPWGTIERSGDPARDRARRGGGRREVEALTVVVGLPAEPLGPGRPGGPGRPRRGGRAARAARAARGQRRDGGRALHHGGGASARCGRRAAPGKAARKVVDSAAAMVLLQAWLDNA